MRGPARERRLLLEVFLRMEGDEEAARRQEDLFLATWLESAARLMAYRLRNHNRASHQEATSEGGWRCTVLGGAGGAARREMVRQRAEELSLGLSAEDWQERADPWSALSGLTPREAALLAAWAAAPSRSGGDSESVLLQRLQLLLAREEV